MRRKLQEESKAGTEASKTMDVLSTNSDSDTSKESTDQEMEIVHDAIKANMFKDRGNQCFKKGDYDEAIHSYTIAIQADLSNPILYGNRAMAFLKKADLLCSKHTNDDTLSKTAHDFYRAVDQDCSQALRLDKDFVKAYFRRGMARKALGMIQEALFDFEAVGRLEPGNSVAEKEAQSLKIDLWAKAKSQKRFFTEFKSSPVMPCARKKDWSGEFKRMRIEELNLKDKEEIETCSDEHREITEKMDIVPRIIMPSPPTTSYEFYADWRDLAGHPKERTQYLMMMGPQGVKAVFQNSMEPDVLSDIIALLYNAVAESESRNDAIADVRTNSVALLEAITHVGRFDTIIMFMSKEETDKLKVILKGETRVEKLWNLL